MVIGLTMDNILNSIMYFMTKKAKKNAFFKFHERKNFIFTQA